MPKYASKKTHTPFTNPYKCRFQTPIYDAKKTPVVDKQGHHHKSRALVRENVKNVKNL